MSAAHTNHRCTDVKLNLVRGITDSEIVVEEANPHDHVASLSDLFPEERAAIVGAVSKRRREFVTGRILCRLAMHRLGCPPRAVRSGNDRAPVWPAGLTGSISHSDTWCAVALARAQTALAIGIDIEDDRPLGDALVPLVFTADEERRLGNLSQPWRGLYSKLGFSAKETAYKAQYGITGQFMDFDAMSVEIDRESHRWRATFNPSHRPHTCPWSEFEGRWVHRRGLVATALVIKP